MNPPIIARLIFSGLFVGAVPRWLSVCPAHPHQLFGATLAAWQKPLGKTVSPGVRELRTLSGAFVRFESEPRIRTSL